MAQGVLKTAKQWCVVARFFKYGIVALCSCQVMPAFAWSATGHLVIGRLAYAKLSPAAKYRFEGLNRVLNDRQHAFNLITASIWLDLLYNQHLRALRRLHYIDIPFSNDGTPLPETAPDNIVAAIHSASQTLGDAQAAQIDKAIALRMLLHLVGDIHQPLHTVTRVSRQHPLGDRGGNDFRLGKNGIAANLHTYWDQGGGLLKPHMPQKAVKELVKSITTRWSCPPADLNPSHWAAESHALAVALAYTLPEYTIPSPAYQSQTKETTERQLTYAGCRLALLLNHLA